MQLHCVNLSLMRAAFITVVFTYSEGSGQKGRAEPGIYKHKPRSVTRDLALENVSILSQPEAFAESVIQI